MKPADIKARGIRAAQIIEAQYGRVIGWENRRRRLVFELRADLAIHGVPRLTSCGFSVALREFINQLRPAFRIVNEQFVALPGSEPQSLGVYEINLVTPPTTTVPAPSPAEITRQPQPCVVHPVLK